MNNKDRLTLTDAETDLINKIDNKILSDREMTDERMAAKVRERGYIDIINGMDSGALSIRESYLATVKRIQDETLLEIDEIMGVFRSV